MQGQSAQQETGQGREVEVSWQRQEEDPLGPWAFLLQGPSSSTTSSLRPKSSTEDSHPGKTTGTPVGYTMNKSHRGVKGLGGPGSGEKLHVCCLCVEPTQEAITMEETTTGKKLRKSHRNEDPI